MGLLQPVGFVPSLFFPAKAGTGTTARRCLGCGASPRFRPVGLFRHFSRWRGGERAGADVSDPARADQVVQSPQRMPGPLRGSKFPYGIAEAGDLGLSRTLTDGVPTSLSSFSVSPRNRIVTSLGT